MSDRSEFTFTWDSRDLAIWRGDSKIESALLRALKLAGNQALRGMQRDSVAEVQRRKLMRREHIDRGTPLVFPSRKDAIRDLVWREKVSGAPVPLGRFPATRTAHGLAVQVNVGAPAKEVKSAFLATLKSGHLGVFVRKGKSRLPIKELWTTRLSDVMGDSAPTITAAAKAKLQSAFAKGMAREIAKLKRKGLA